MQAEFKKTTADCHSQYRLNIKKSLVISLLFFNLLVLLSPRLHVQIEEKEPPNIIIDVENIPVTRQTRRTPPPPKPTVPVPSDDETIPEDETIEETTLKVTNIFDYTDGLPGITGITETPPKRLKMVFPEYPDGEGKKGVVGFVRLSLHIDKKGKVVEVVVLENTTNSDKYAQNAIDAAFDTPFSPAKEGNKSVSSWFPLRYDFYIE